MKSSNILEKKEGVGVVGGRKFCSEIASVLVSYITSKNFQLETKIAALSISRYCIRLFLMQVCLICY
jgi:hypothetical protein